MLLAAKAYKPKLMVARIVKVEAPPSEQIEDKQ
jgi:hypothetical protein